MRYILIITVLGLGFFSCQNTSNPITTANAANQSGTKAVLTAFDPNQFNNYWYAGKAELNSYDYTINRYSEDRNGYAVFVFVTEDFSNKKQVKLDDPARAGDDRVPVLKLNSLQRFQTGIYDYSMMSSLFTPIDYKKYPRSLKLTTTVQDWCGHVFAQLNFKNNQYQVNSFSYFETEGDKSFSTEGVMLEGDIFMRLRLDPESLPKDEIKVLPDLTYTRLRHKELAPSKAMISIKQNSNASSTCALNYPDIKRRLEVEFETAFPHKILGWTEYDGDKILSKAQLRKSLMSDYWMQNAKSFDYMRKELDL